MTVADRIGEVRERIEAACVGAGREAASVRLIGVTKTVAGERVREALDAGLTDVAENHVQALLERHATFPEAAWHHVGRIQSNKAPRVAEVAAWAHALEPGRAAERLARRARAIGRTVPCLLEVDFTRERIGVAPEDVEGALEALAVLEGIAVRGLMTVAPLGTPPGPVFARLRELRDLLAGPFPGLRELSMGMSVDYEEAVGEGATMVRVGSAIFGPRP